MIIVMDLKGIQEAQQLIIVVGPRGIQEGIMLQLVGLTHNVELKIREKFSIIPKHQEMFLNKLLEFCDEAVILSTCNRTEIYFNSVEEKQIIQRVFKALNWDDNLIKYVFYKSGIQVTAHLMEVICGFDSILIGEDQILGQVKNAYDTAFKAASVSGNMQRLFQRSIACGKEFRTQSGISNIPVSSSSLIVKEAVGRNIKSFMVLGFGEIGELTCKYILEENIDVLYIVVRSKHSVKIKDPRIRLISFGEQSNYYDKVQCIVACTSAPHIIVKHEELPNINYLIYDLSVPRNVDERIDERTNVELYDIDRVTLAHNEKLDQRRRLMEEYKYILKDHIDDFNSWQSIRNINKYIRRIKENGEVVYTERHKTFVNKKDTKDNVELAKVLLKSTSDAYVNKAIEVLKEEHLKGRGEDCLKILERIFL